MSTARDNALTNGQGNYITHNLSLVQHLPEPGEVWEVRDVELLDQYNVLQMRQLEIVEVVERDQNSRDNYEGPHNHYRTPEHVYESIQDLLENRDALPCGCGGFTTLEAGERYTCSGPCDTEYDREAIEEVFC